MLKRGDMLKKHFINLSVAIIFIFLFYILTMKQMIENVSGASMHECLYHKTIPALRNTQQGRADDTTFHLR